MRPKVNNIITKGDMSRYKWYQSLYPIENVANENFDFKKRGDCNSHQSLEGKW